MSFLTEYFDEYRPHHITKSTMCRPENRWAKLEGTWLDPKKGAQDKAWTDEQIDAFIKDTMRRLRGQSTYYNDYCSNLSPEFKTRPFVPRVKKKKPCIDKGAEVVEEAAIPPPAQKLAIKDTELMKMAKELYDPDVEKPTLEPIPTHLRMAGYGRPSVYRTGLSEYQRGIARLAYELVRDGRAPPYRPHNGCRPKWPLPPEGRQPQLDAVPFDGERLY